MVKGENKRAHGPPHWVQRDSVEAAKLGTTDWDGRETGDIVFGLSRSRRLLARLHVLIDWTDARLVQLQRYRRQLLVSIARGEQYLGGGDG